MVRGIILNAAAIGANLTTVMRIQLPLAGLANMIVPNLEIVPTISQDKFCRDPEEVCSKAIPFHTPQSQHGGVLPPKSLWLTLDDISAMEQMNA